MEDKEVIRMYLSMLPELVIIHALTEAYGCVPVTDVKPEWRKAAAVFSVPVEQLPNTLTRIVQEIIHAGKGIRGMERLLNQEAMRK